MTTRQKVESKNFFWGSLGLTSVNMVLAFAFEPHVVMTSYFPFYMVLGFSVFYTNTHKCLQKMVVGLTHTKSKMTKRGSKILF